MQKTKKAYQRPADYVPKQYSPTDLAYMAGIIDGEGCFWIGIIPKKQGDGYVSDHYRGLLKVTNNDPKLIDWIINTFEGTHSARMRYQPKGKFEREVHEWVATGDRLRDLCEVLLPYLILKKEHCRIMIEFRKTYANRLGNNQVSLENLTRRRELYTEIRQLNSRFHGHPMKKHNQ